MRHDFVILSRVDGEGSRSQRSFAPLRMTAVALLALSAACAHQTPQQPSERHYTMMLGANRAGTQVTRVDGKRRIIDFEFNDRGRGPKTTSEIRVSDRFIPTLEKTTGVDYYKGPVDETLTTDASTARWHNKAEDGQRTTTTAFYLSMFGPPEETGLLANALLASPNHRLALLPAGEASIEKSTELTVGGKHIIDYAISGLGFTPIDVWLDGDGTYVGYVSSWSTLVRDGYESAIQPMLDAQKAAADKRSAAITQRLTHRPPGGSIVIRNANLFDSVNAVVVPFTTVVIRGDRITAVGPSAAAPEGATVIDAAGKTLMPGLWDMHVHLQPDDGLLDIAAGVTTVRDMANDIDFLMEEKKRFNDGTEIGPRIIAAGFMDGPGPYAGPTKVLVNSEDEIRAAIDRYKRLGYEQIKIYSSIRPELVPFITRYAHQNGLRVSGHIPAFMFADQAVEQGYNEIQHMNFLFLNFMRDVQETRTPARFTTVAERGADLDLQSSDVRAFIDLLKSKSIVSDPTLSVFEGMFTDRPGVMSSVFAEVGGRFPPQVRRGFLTGGLPVPEGKDARYRASFQKMLQFTKLLYDSGVRIVGGTDGMAGYQLARELELYVDAGIPAPAALQIATIRAARVMQHDTEIGSIEPGKLADVILIDGNPAADIHALRKVTMVIRGGVMFDPREIERVIGVSPN
jgi:amidohydrolase family protein